MKYFPLVRVPCHCPMSLVCPDVSVSNLETNPPSPLWLQIALTRFAKINNPPDYSRYKLVCPNQLRKCVEERGTEGSKKWQLFWTVTSSISWMRNCNGIMCMWMHNQIAIGKQYYLWVWLAILLHNNDMITAVKEHNFAKRVFFTLLWGDAFQPTSLQC